MDIWNFYRKLFQDNMFWLRRVVILAGVAGLVGILTYAFNPALLPKFLSFLEGVFKDILGGRDLELNFASVLRIFENNLTVGILVMFAGVFFGLLPLLSLGVNFFIMGFLLAAFVGTGQFGKVGIFAVSVIPHGVVELPTFLIAAAFGVRLGSFWLQPDKSRSIWGNLKDSLKANFQVLPFLVVFFFIAALLEIFVSGRLVQFFVK